MYCVLLQLRNAHLPEEHFRNIWLLFRKTTKTLDLVNEGYYFTLQVAEIRKL